MIGKEIECKSLKVSKERMEYSSSCQRVFACDIYWHCKTNVYIQRKMASFWEVYFCLQSIAYIVFISVCIRENMCKEPIIYQPKFYIIFHSTLFCVKMNVRYSKSNYILRNGACLWILYPLSNNVLNKNVLLLQCRSF